METKIQNNILSECGKEIAISFLKYQSDQIKEMINKMENEIVIEKDMLENFCIRKNKLEKKILNTITN